MTAERRLAALCVVVALSLGSAPALALEPTLTSDGEAGFEPHAFYKAFDTALRLSDGLVHVGDSVGLELPSYGASETHTGRVWGSASPYEWLVFQAGYQLSVTTATDRALLGSSALGGGVAATSAQTAKRRLVDFDPILDRNDHALVQHNLDLLAIELKSSAADFTVGRQALSWGSGRLWNPTDLLSPFGPSDIDREVRRGIDAARVSVPLSATAELDVLWLPQRAARDQGGVVRAQSNIAGFDVAPSVAKYVRDAVFGFDVSGDIGPLGVHTEAAWTTAFDRNPDGTRDRFLRAVVGADGRPSDELTIAGEYYFNGWGASGASGYAGVLRSPRVTRGEVFGAGRHYLGLVVAWQASELVTLAPVLIANLQDPSVLFVPGLEYWAAQHILIRVGGYVPVGAQPDSDVFSRLTPADLRNRTPAWRDAVDGLGLRSEYGASPFGLYAELVVNLH